MESIFCRVCNKEYGLVNRGFFRTNYCSVWRKPRLKDMVLICDKCNKEYPERGHFVGLGPGLLNNWEWFEVDEVYLVNISQKIYSFRKRS